MVCQRPVVIERELVNPDQPRGWGSHRLHCATGPAVAWPDGWGLWYWHGIRVSQHVIEAPQTITVKEIDAEKNTEVRRAMMERMGFDRYLTLSKTKPVQQDDFGKLYRRDVEGDEPLVMIEVVNSTPEPDGSFKHYWLRVPPDMQTARQAVAWSFGHDDPSTYEPVLQS